MKRKTNLNTSVMYDILMLSTFVFVVFDISSLCHLHALKIICILEQFQKEKRYVSG